MSENEITKGRTWIENTLRSIATEFGVKIVITEWRHVGLSEYLTYAIDGKPRVEKFSEDNIEDCQNSENVKSSLEDRLRKMITSACSSTPKIGFNRT